MIKIDVNDNYPIQRRDLNVYAMSIQFYDSFNKLHSLEAFTWQVYSLDIQLLACKGILMFSKTIKIFACLR